MSWYKKTVHKKEDTKMTEMITVRVKDQYSNELNAMAWLNKLQEHEDTENLSLFQKIDHIIVDGEKILPSIELLFESKESDSIYRIIEQVS